MEIPFVYRLITKILSTYYLFKVGASLILYYVTHPFTKWTKERPVPPKCLQGNRHGEHKFAQLNDIKIHYVEKGDHDKPLIIFVHGFPEFWYTWRFQLDELSKKYWCVAIDNRGYGESSKPSDVCHYKIDMLVEDIKNLALYLGRKRFTLIGHDWGAVITYRFVDTYGKDMLNNFIAMSGPSSDIWEKLVLSEWWQFRNSWYVFFMMNPCVPELAYSMNDLQMFKNFMLNPKDPNCPVTDEDIEAYKYTFGQPGALKAPIDYYRANFLMTGGGPEHIECPPGLFIIGEKDSYVSQSNTALLKKKYDGLQTLVFKNGRHFLHQENPVQINKIISDFLEQ